MKVSFRADSSTSGSVTYDQMSFKLAKYALNGSWLGTEDLSTQLQYCRMDVPYTSEGAGSSSSTRWLQFGHNIKQSYQCNLTQLMEQETYFYDLYVVDQVSTLMLYAIFLASDDFAFLQCVSIHPPSLPEYWRARGRARAQS